MYKERYNTTKFIDLLNFKFQNSLLFIIILALIFRVTVLIQQILGFGIPYLCLPIYLGMTFSKGCHMATVP